MTEIRSLIVTPPRGEWIAVNLLERESEDTAWDTVQAARVREPGPMAITFRPRVEDGEYKAIWVPEGGSRAGLAEGPVQRLGEAKKEEQLPPHRGGPR